jgi:hypothetical protein
VQSLALHVAAYAPPIDYDSRRSPSIDQILETVVAHLAVQYSLDLVLFLTVDESWGWG